MRQINCEHYLKECNKTDVYTYHLDMADLNLCKRCERLLRKQVKEQILAEVKFI